MENTDCNLLLSLQVLSLQKTCTLLKKCNLQISEKNSSLTIDIPNQAVASLLEWQQGYIAAVAYLKLGCSTIYFQLNNLSLWAYNLSDVFAADEYINLRISMQTLEREQQVQAQRTSNWISFGSIAETISQKLGVDISADDVEEKAEKFKIPALRQSGVYGLAKSSLQSFIDKFLADFRNEIIAEMLPPQNRVNRKQASTASVETKSLEGEMVLPEDVETIIKGGRTRKADLKTGLRLLLEEMAQEAGDYAVFLQNIILNKREARNFVQQLAEIYKSPNHSVSKRVSEIRNAAQELNDAVQNNAA